VSYISARSFPFARFAILHRTYIYPIIYSFFLNRDYLNRIVFYNKSQWQCAVTGRQGLTYEEALENEKKHREQLKKFPRGLKQHILQMVQFSKYMNFKYFVVNSRVGIYKRIITFLILIVNFL